VRFTLGAVTDAGVATVSKAVFFPGEGRSAYLGVRMRY
jgi:iron complex outermembrane receptor protein